MSQEGEDADRLTHYALATFQVPGGATQHMQSYALEHRVRVFFKISKWWDIMSQEGEDAYRPTHYALATFQVPGGATQGQHMQSYALEHLVEVFFMISKRTTL
jgi:hypothetical protein